MLREAAGDVRLPLDATRNRQRACFSPAPPSAADLKKSLQRWRERFSSVEAQRIHAGAIECAIQFLEPLDVGVAESFAHGIAGGIQFQEFARFSVLDGEQTGIRQR